MKSSACAIATALILLTGCANNNQSDSSTAGSIKSAIPIYDSFEQVPFEFVPVATLGLDGKEITDEFARGVAEYQQATAVVRGGPENEGFFEGDIGPISVNQGVFIIVRPAK